MSLRDLEASDKQYALMDKLGIEYDPQGVSVAEASKLIDAKLGKKPKDISSNYSQGDSLIRKRSESAPQGDISNGSLRFAPDRDAQFRTPTQLTRIDCLKAAIEFIGLSEKNSTMRDTVKITTEIAEEFGKWVNR